MIERSLTTHQSAIPTWELLATRKDPATMAGSDGKTPSIKIINGALDDYSGNIVLNGIVAPESLTHLQYADYQREMLSPAKISALEEAHRNGRVPNIELGMRGQRCIEREGIFYLQDDVFVVDGQQRTIAALRVMEKDSSVRPHIGVTVHFDTTEEWERDRFKKLNLGQSKLSSNVTARNLRYDLPVMALLYKLSSDKTFVMKDRICWNQTMAKGELISAVTFLKVIGMLHSHMGPGKGTDVTDLANGLQKIMDNIGKAAFTANVRAYFDTVDRAFGVQQVAYKNGANHLKSTFSLTLAKIFSEHEVFWKGDLLTVDETSLRKLASFPTTDPHVANLASSAGKAGEILFVMIVDHINSGRRSRRLQRRNWVDEVTVDPSAVFASEED